MTKVTVLVVLDRMGGVAHSWVLRLRGRTVVMRIMHDEAVRLGAGVAVVRGVFAPAGGTAAYPALGAVDGVVLAVRDMALSVARALAAESGPGAVVIVRTEAAEAAPVYWAGAEDEGGWPAGTRPQPADGTHAVL